MLVVDDDASVRTMLCTALSLEEGFGEVRVATDGRDALRIVEDYRPDVVVLDFTMPVMNGAEAATHIRRLHPGTRIVVFSGVVHETPEWADDCVVKGTDLDLRAVITSALDT